MLTRDRQAKKLISTKEKHRSVKLLSNHLRTSRAMYKILRRENKAQLETLYFYR